MDMRACLRFPRRREERDRRSRGHLCFRSRKKMGDNKTSVRSPDDLLFRKGVRKKPSILKKILIYGSVLRNKRVEMESKMCVNPKTFDADDLVFDEAREGKMGDGVPFKKTNIGVKKSDGSTGPLCVVTEPCFSFGFLEDKKYGGGYSISLAVLDKDCPTKKQKDFVKMMKKILSACRPKPKSCFYGEDKNAVMYVKMDYDKYSDEFFTSFLRKEGHKRRKHDERGRGSEEVRGEEKFYVEDDHTRKQYFRG